MARIEFTKQFIDGIKPAASVIDLTDIKTTGLHFKVTPGGARSWCFIFRSKVTGKVQNLLVGHYPAIDLATARKLVDAAWTQVELGKPVVFTIAKKNELTIDELLAKYNEGHLVVKHRDGGNNVRSCLARLILRNKWTALPVTALTKQHVRDAVGELRARGKLAMANKAQKHVAGMFSWAARHDVIAVDPISNMETVVPEGEPRARTLNSDEIRKLWRACHAPQNFNLHPVHARALLLILTTGCRPGMACAMAQTELHLEHAEGPLWDVPAEKMKQGKPFVCPLNQLAIGVIKSAEAVSGYICPTTSPHITARGEHLQTSYLSYVCQGLSQALGFATPFTPHDLRRTAFELLCNVKPANRARYDETEVDPLFAHEHRRGVGRKHYNPANRWKRLEEKREMADFLATILKRIVFDGVVLKIAA